MSIPGKVLIALLSSLVVAAVAAFVEPSYSFVGLLLPTAVAAVASVVLSHRALPVPEAIATDTQASGTGKDRQREQTAGRDPGSDRSGQPDKRRDSGRDAGRDGSRGGGRNKGRDSRGGRSDRGDRARRDTRGAADADARPSPSASDKAVSRGPAEEGTVKWFNVTKGFGFIIRDSGEEIFVHHRSVLGEGRGRLEDGAAVRYRVAETDKGPQAEDVEPL